MSLPLVIPEKCLCKGLLPTLHRTTLIIVTFGYIITLSLYLGVLLPVALNQRGYYQLPTYLRTPEYMYSTQKPQRSLPIAVLTTYVTEDID